MSKQVRLHSSIHHPLLRAWTTGNIAVSAEELMLPLFIVEDNDAKEEITTMPGVYRYGVNTVLKELEPLVKLGLKSVLLFGVISKLTKDEYGTHADSPENPVIRLVPMICEKFPNLVIACDVCLCPYTSHGHCGILKENGKINNDKSIKRISEIALAYAQAGCHIVAPSDMMDGRIGAIKQSLEAASLHDKTILSYAAKFSSSFYGPFREAAKSAPSFGDRKCYQLPPGSSGLAHRAVSRDVSEGADFLMVKPGLAYLDILSQVKKEFPNYPLFVYQVSGEYAMLYFAANSNAINLRTAVEESLISFKRAGADCVITYFTPLLLQWMAVDRKN
ncbi:delta-aminolevulinic acid dehydratase isoform X2 [Cimex lectularius]|nr:delta-aminolevulinic acid dehydratase isoform X2 [Cimex lectularius]XP_024082129.1 delta-aminolevulinic acid dehydratase isoform X2 [Cimex lectularius]